MSFCRMDTLVVCFLVGFVGVGCSSQAIKSVRDASRANADQGPLVAFSVSTAEAFAIGRIELVVAGEQRERVAARQVSVDWSGGDEPLFLFRVPQGQARFGRVRFVFLGEWWETTDSGPEIPTAPGSLTYLGRIQPYSIQVGRYADSGRGYPSAVKIRVLDASEQDLPRLVGEYAVPPALPVNGAVPDSWGQSEFSELRYRPIPGRERVSLVEYVLTTNPTGPAPKPAPPPRKP